MLRTRQVEECGLVNGRAWLLGLGLLSVRSAAEGPASQAPRLAPIGNYHAHLVSEQSRVLILPREISVVELPAELGRVIRDFERFTNAAAADSLASLFTEDGLFSSERGWVRGRAAIRSAASNEDRTDQRVRALAFQVRDSVATVTGALVDDSARGRDVAEVMFALGRAGNGRWLIQSYLREFRPPLNEASGAVFDAKQLVAQLDSAGIKRAVVLSVAYWFGSKLMPGADTTLSLEDEYARVKRENDWVVSEVARYPDRLVAFCSVHPLKSYAREEIARCGRNPGVRGLKLHLANSGVDLRSSADVERLRQVFRAANEQRLPIVVHMRPRLEPYGREDAEIMLREVIPEAPDVSIQIAHLAGWGSYDDAADRAAAVFSEAIAKGDPRTKHLYFDLTSILVPGQSIELRRKIASRIRSLGVRRVLYGSDLTDPGADWANIVRWLPVSRAELAAIAGNVTPYLTPRPAARATPRG